MVTCNIVILYLWNLALTFKSSETGLGVYCFVFIYLESSGSDPSHVRCTLYPGDQTGLDVNVRLSHIAHSYLLDLGPSWKGTKASCITHHRWKFRYEWSPSWLLIVGDPVIDSLGLVRTTL